MNKITLQTQQKIKRLFSHHFRLHKSSIHFKILEKLFNHIEIDDSKSRIFLQKRKLIDENHKLTPLGFGVIISHNLGISLFSVFLISQIYAYQIKISSGSIFPKQTIVKCFENFSNEKTMNVRITELKQKNILLSLGYQQLRITENTMKKLCYFKSKMLLILEYFYEIDEQVDELIHNDPIIQQNIKNNLKLAL